MDFIYTYQLNLIFRMLVACVCGIVIGLERKNRAKEAGIRTHCIVACASALMMIISKYGFEDLIAASLEGVDVRLDPSRMAQGIVTGVGFLGAGMIYFQRGSLIGLTTASGIWATSGIGMAIGAGMYIIGISATCIILLVQIILHTRNKIVAQHKLRHLSINGVQEEHFQKKVSDMLAEMKISVNDISVKKNKDSIYDYTFFIEMPNGIKEEDIIELFDYECSIKFMN